MTSEEALSSTWAKWVAPTQYQQPSSNFSQRQTKQISSTSTSTITSAQTQQRQPRVSSRFSASINSAKLDTSSKYPTTFTNKTHQKKLVTTQEKPQVVTLLKDRIKNLETEIANLKIDCNVMQKEVSQHATWKRMNDTLDRELSESLDELSSYNFYNERTQKLQLSRSSSISARSNDYESDLNSTLLSKIEKLKLETRELQERLETTLKFKKNSDQERQIWTTRLVALDSEWDKLKDRICYHHSIKGSSTSPKLLQLDNRNKVVRSQIHSLKEHLDSLEIKLKAYKDESKTNEDKKSLCINQIIKLRQIQKQIREMKTRKSDEETNSNKLSKRHLARLRKNVKHEEEAIASLNKQIEDLKEDLRLRNTVIESLHDSKFVSSLAKGCLELEQYEKFCEEYYTSIKKSNMEKLKELGSDIKKVEEKRTMLHKHISLLETSSSSRDKKQLTDMINTKRRLEMESEKLDQLKPIYDQQMRQCQEEISGFKEQELTIRDFAKDKLDIEKRLSDTEASISDLKSIKEELKQALGELESTYNELMSELEEKNRQNGEFATGLEAKNVREIMTLRDDCNKLHDSVMKRILSKTEDE